MTDLDAPPGTPGHPTHPTQAAFRLAELHFLQSLRLASEEQLLQMRRTFLRIGTSEVSWKLAAVRRQLARRYREAGWDFLGR